MVYLALCTSPLKTMFHSYNGTILLSNRQFEILFRYNKLIIRDNQCIVTQEVFNRGASLYPNGPEWTKLSEWTTEMDIYL